MWCSRSRQPELPRLPEQQPREHAPRPPAAATPPGRQARQGAGPRGEVSSHDDDDDDDDDGNDDDFLIIIMMS